MESIEKQLRIYRTADGRIPYLDWFYALRDEQARQRIQVRLGRVRLGNLGSTQSVGEGVQELKIDCGPGYRLYFGQDGPQLVVLLCAGDKRTQDEDIKKAKSYWADYKKEKKYANY